MFIVYIHGMDKRDIKKEQLKDLSSDALSEMVLDMMDQLEKANQKYNNLLEQIAIANSRKYGRKTEVSTNQMALFDIYDNALNEAEITADDVPEPELEQAAPKRKKKKGKKASDIARIAKHREEYIEISDEELDKIYGAEKWKRLSYQEVTKLEHVPESFEAVTYKIGTYIGTEDEKIIRADRPVELFPKSIVTPSLLASIMDKKFVNALPLYRQEKALESNDIFISRTVMANWVIMGAKKYLRPFYELLKKELVSQDLIHADETPFKVVKDGRKAGSKSYMWVYRTVPGTTEKPVVLYDYCATRETKNIETFLGKYSGTIICDGYSAYHSMEKKHSDRYTVAGCWVHTKRKFNEVVKAYQAGKKKTPNSTLAMQGQSRISNIYHQEHKIQKKDLTLDEKREERQKIIQPLVDEFFEWAKKYKDLVDKESAIGRAINYALNQEKYLRVFLTDARIPLDNNAAERAIRPFTIGRKNWVIAYTIKGAEASAIAYSIVETAKANNLNVYEYLKYLFEELPKYVHDLEVDEIPENLYPWSKDLPDHIRK